MTRSIFILGCILILGADAAETEAMDYAMDAAFMDICNAAYLQGHTWQDKFASPMCASDRELRALPSVHIFAAEALSFSRRVPHL